MTVVHEPGSTRPGRAAGLVLIGVAVIALVLGVITLLDDGGGDNPPSGAPPSSQPSGAQPPGSGTQPPGNSSPGSGSPGSGGPGSGGPGSGTQPPATPPNTPPPANTTTVAQPPPAPPPPPDPRRVPLRVLNNGTITGLAAQAAGDFRADGWTVAEVGNYSQGIIPTTTAYFRPGTEEEAAARTLAAKFDMRAEARFPGIAGASPGVIVMITNDYGGK
jgi:hypothetical protein